jgi:hypothetical protein
MHDRFELVCISRCIPRKPEVITGDYGQMLSFCDIHCKTKFDRYLNWLRDNDCEESARERIAEGYYPSSICNNAPKRRRV